MRIDALDAALIRLLTDAPQLPVLECARRLGVARGTVTSRLARLHENGVIEG
ncbi:AsnC family transcriptional regulator, partial [Microbacterium azadirachtae]|uniref:AsnC family transcriptional regulator n=2 Tax=Microbacterium TaxID=33882 RepID=UPI003F74F48B